MPSALRRRVRSLSDTIALDLQPAFIALNSQVMMTLSLAAQNQQQVRMRYRSAIDAETERDFDPYGLAFREGNWYAAGFCHLRHGLRSFRLDRIQDIQLLEARYERPPEFDVMAYLAESMKMLPRKHPVEVFIRAPLEAVRMEVPEDEFLLEPQAGGVLMRGRTDDVYWLAQKLARVSHPFIIREPAELREALRAHALKLLESAG